MDGYAGFNQGDPTANACLIRVLFFIGIEDIGWGLFGRVNYFGESIKKRIAYLDASNRVLIALVQIQHQVIAKGHEKPLVRYFLYVYYTPIQISLLPELFPQDRPVLSWYISIFVIKISLFIA